VILFLSPDAGDGRSTIVADLALVQRDAGERVAVIEADLRRPVLSRLLDVTDARGLVDVLAGTLTLEQAMQSVARAEVPLGPDGVAPEDSPTATLQPPGGEVSVLVAGGPAANPPALLASVEMRDLLATSADAYDYVLVDAPPPLEVSDVLPLLGVVDGIVIVARAEHTRSTSAERFSQLLRRTPSALVLGVVANSVSTAEIARYGFSSSSHGGQGRRRKLLLR
jgi:receptor protein-tyrosine kinase